MADEQSVKIFKVKGMIRGKKKSVFTKEFCALSEKNAEEKVKTDFGSKNRVKRNQIKITSIEEISKDEVTDKNLLAFLEKDDIRIPYGG